MKSAARSAGFRDRPIPFGGKSGGLRAAVFGVNDGLVSNLALVMGVAGAGVSRSVVVVAGIAGLLAGAFSMGAGEYVSMRLQREMFEGILAREARLHATAPEVEAEELIELLERRYGLPRHATEEAVRAAEADPEVALEFHAKLELGLDPTELGSPAAAALSSFVAFVAGAALPLMAFLLSGGSVAIGIAASSSLLALFGVGAAMSFITERSWALSGTRMVAIGGAAAFITYIVGRLIGIHGL